LAVQILAAFDPQLSLAFQAHKDQMEEAVLKKAAGLTKEWPNQYDQH